MAKVKSRGNSWVIDYSAHGKRVRQSFKSKKLAQAELAKRVSLIAEGRYLDYKKDYKTILWELVERYIENYQDQASYKTAKQYFLKDIVDHFGKNTLLINIQYYDLEKYRNYLKQKPTKNGTYRKSSSINRPIACLKHLFSKAVEWDLIEQSPFTKGESLLLKENNERTRFLTEDEITKLLKECPGYLQNIVKCALTTGMRKGEILSLKWSQIRNGFIYLRKTKTKRQREIPVSDDLKSLFNEIRRDQHLISDHVFLYNDRPVHNVKNSFKGALRRSGIEDFCFHDLRHTFASLVIMRGGGLRDVKELLGHKSLVMTMRYSHLTSDHKLKAVNLLNGVTRHKVGTNYAIGKQRQCVTI